MVTWRRSRPLLRPTTLEIYGSSLGRLLLPYFGDVALGDITSDMVGAWHAWASHPDRRAVEPKRKPGQDEPEPKKPLSASTIGQAYRLLSEILGHAVDEGILLRNPCRLRGVANPAQTELRIPTAVEVAAITRTIDARYSALVQVAAWGGLRWGELVGLQRRRVDLAKGTVTVAVTVSQPKNGTFVVGPPKTAAGARTVIVPPEVVDALTSHMDTYSEAGKEGLVFPALEGGYLQRSNFRDRVWLPALEEAGVEHVRFHDLRHFHATVAIAAGADTKVLMGRMGHASHAAALRYQHATPGRDEAIAKALGEVMESLNSAHESGSEPQGSDARGTYGARGHLHVVK